MSNEHTLGAVPVAEGEVEFRVWAPRARSVAVRLESGDSPLRNGETWSGRAPAAHGDDYRFVVDGEELRDPCSRWQPEGLLGPSRVLAVPRSERLGVPLDGLVLYELHVGAFSAEGTFDGAIPHLGALRELGVTAIELMPVATFPGDRGWGYDGVFTSAPHPAYGGPDGLARLIRAAHAAGLGVILDVVYNHVGPGSELVRLGPYFTDRHETFWGDALDYSRRFVREWAIQNAELWIRDYGVDGLRLDATHAVFDDSEVHVLRELRDRVKAIDERALVIAEMTTGDLRPTRDWGHDAQWADELHHELHALLTGEQEGYYAGYGSPDGLARQLRRSPPERLVVCSQDHDQVGNRALGDRPRREELRARAAVVCFAPQTPLLFMGEEYGERAPFRFFTDHVDPLIADATREGRRREFERFAAFAGADVPDPQAPETFAASKLTREEDGELRAFYAELLALRRGLPRSIETRVDGSVLRMRRGAVAIEVDFGERTVRRAA
ncbi:MAG TPA: alpha-amylase family glycosyl hydrolase [Gaiellaceae bacterium]|nr:alpha-amylase family glycosyl hydrolase [Gaiellaceae bacterium]